MAQVEALKILVAGNVNGNMGYLLERVASLGKKTKFDVLIILGSLFTPADSASDIEWMDEVASYFPKYKCLPDDIYIMGPPNCKQLPEQVLTLYRKMIRLGKTDELSIEETDKLLESGTDVLSGRMTLLGSRGVFDCSSGLKIAYFAGDETTGITDGDLQSFNFTLSSSSSTFDSFSNCDIFLTSSWPKGIIHNTTVPVPAEVSSFSSNNSSVLVAKAASLIQPRYHFTCSSLLYYERQPYRNHQVLAEKIRPVTRFISLADVPVKTAKKATGPKWLYAFNLKPTVKLLQLDKESGKNEGRKELITQPGDTTESPFASMDLSISLKKSNDTQDNGQFFYQMPVRKVQAGNKRPHSNDQGPHQSSRHGGNSGPRQGRQEKEPRRNEPLDPGNCWFCLSSPDVEKEYIISIGDNCYLALAKGGLVEDHVLILPIDHIRSSLEASDELREEIAKFKNCLTKFYASHGKDVAFFERNFKSQHMQIQAVPIPYELLQEDKDHLARLEEEKTKPPQDTEERGDDEEHEETKAGGEDDCSRKRGGPICQLVKGIINSHRLRYRLIEKDASLTSHIEKMLPYFHIEIPAISFNAFVIINTKKKDSHGNLIKFPLQIGREILAHVLRLDELSVDWRIVTTNLTKNQEAARTINFRKRFEPFDFTVEM